MLSNKYFFTIIKISHVSNLQKKYNFQHHEKLPSLIIVKHHHPKIFFVFSKERKGYQIIWQAQNRTEIIDHM